MQWSILPAAIAACDLACSQTSTTHWAIELRLADLEISGSEHMAQGDSRPPGWHTQSGKNITKLVILVYHYNDVIMGAMASQIISLTVYSTVYSDADQRKHQSFTPLAFVGVFTGDLWIPRTDHQ